MVPSAPSGPDSTLSLQNLTLVKEQALGMLMGFRPGYQSYGLENPRIAQDLSNSDTAQELDVSPGGRKSTLSRCATRISLV